MGSYEKWGHRLSGRCPLVSQVWPSIVVSSRRTCYGHSRVLQLVERATKKIGVQMANAFSALHRY